ncbi:hypothetical protein F2Q68_00034380 [Brassica cretica]|uniref:Helicase ATP-binding domain-containing protein n=1 Tax=Brassica cretica TaxID=69181 RepID=A0A8S9GWT3_BRACR|nr:hypothetical protein F2Q68_00034380 [Brassica cretica]
MNLCYHTHSSFLKLPHFFTPKVSPLPFECDWSPINKSLTLSRELGEVEYLVLDEADQMLAVGFEEAVESILENLPQKRQSMLFSATMPTWVKKLTRKYLDNPVFSGEVVKDGKITLEGFTVAARAFADKWKRHNQSFPPWSWVPLINRTLLKEEGYLALEKIIILTSLEESAEEESLDVTAG